MDTPARPLLIVDAANVVGSRPDGWWRDRAGAVRRLHQALSRGPADLGEIVLVVEGAARAGVGPGMTDSVRVVHAAGSGDDAIVELVAAEVDREPHRPITVVTADRELRRRVTPLGATILGPTALWQRLLAHP
ncbi:MAG TPA: hypothetical protein VLJ59_18315 [Mycobacteriales bacterium]|nr:hypothetical protein [Mycobacteriales bacterium]